VCSLKRDICFAGARREFKKKKGYMLGARVVVDEL
jgi:hypothetical protein